MDMITSICFILNQIYAANFSPHSTNVSLQIFAYTSSMGQCKTDVTTLCKE